tara:strand:- start:2031 stop:2705 length:675 start_codon:yes stop_codon:yes gene_type:complete
MNRFLDILLSGSALLILSPLFFLIIVILKLTGEHEVFYFQDRIGYKRKVFKVFKFVTMIKNSEKLPGGTLTMKNDERVLPIGRFLRKTKINELPQLINILLGDMSIVGPRPLVPEGEDNYRLEDSKIIRSIRPGASGIGSLILRDEESYYAHRSDAHEFYKNIISPYKGSIEIWYVSKKSFLLDIKIIILTVFAIIKPNFDPCKHFDNIPQMPEEMISSKNISI